MSPNVTEMVMWDGDSWEGSIYPEPAQPEDPFELMVTEPTASNTGFRVPEISLSNYAGDLTNVQSGDIVDRLAITGKTRPLATVTATYRDCLLLGQTQAQATGTSYYEIGDHTATTQVGAGLVTYEFCEIRATLPSYKNNGWKGGNVMLYRCKGVGLTDFLSPHGSSGQGVSKTFRAHGCYAADFVTSVEPVQNQSDLITHNDYSQSQGLLSVYELLGCANGTNGRPRTSWALLQKSQGSYGIVRIIGNWARGAETTGSTFNVPPNLLASDFQEFHFQNNRVSITGKTPRVLISSSVRTGHAATIFGNIELETGLPLTINNA